MLTNLSQLLTTDEPAVNHLLIKAPLTIARAPLRTGSVHLFFIGLSVCRQNVYTKTQFSQKLSNLELQSLLTNVSEVLHAFQRTHEDRSHVTN